MVSFPFLINEGFSQQAKLATFQESAQIVVDGMFSQNVTASITMQSTSNQEIKIPTELEQKILSNDRIIAVILTNEENCILGVFDDSCIMINVKRDLNDKGIVAIQNSTKLVANQFIDDLNKQFDTSARFHSVFVHHQDESNIALDTSGVVSGRDTVSAVYTMPREETSSMFEKISALLIAKEIRDADGFYLAAKEVSKSENSRMSFSIIPMGSSNLYQLKVKNTLSQQVKDTHSVDPVQVLGLEQLKRSDYFSSGNYPLNSIINVIVLSDESVQPINIKGNVLPTKVVDGVKIPTDISKEGWVFDPERGEKIDAKFIFGGKNVIKNGEIKFDISSVGDASESGDNIEEIIFIPIIIAVAAGAILFFLRGYKRKN